jgi:hypothetical protein
MWDKLSSRSRDVSAEIEASDLLRQSVGVPAFGAGNVKSAIWQAVKLTGFTYSRTRKIWYGEAKVSPKELDRLRALSGKRERAASLVARGDLSNNYAVLGERLDALENELADLRRRLARAAVDG